MAEAVHRLPENLRLLEERDPGLAAAIRGSIPDPRLVFMTARNGASVPAVRSVAGTSPLHSLYDPRREGKRLAEASRGAGCLVVCGLGGGYHLEAMLEDKSLRSLVVVEKDGSVLRSLMDSLDLTRLLRDRRLSIVCGTSAIPAALAAAWKPALAGTMKSAALRAWCDREKDFFRQATDSIQQAVESVRADYGVQSHFGKRWFSNMLHNLPLVCAAPAAPTARSAAVIAAGPSLDEQVRQLAARKADSLLIATDTSLPALLGRGIAPDAVLSIDCQVYGYHHFLKGLPPGTRLFLDLASPPQLARLRRAPFFMASGHPFARYLSTHLVPLPRLDTSGGNVTHAAVALARSLGATEITVYGADFSYPKGKAYARGTYLYDLFRSSAGRLQPAESSLLRLALENARRDRPGDPSVFTTPLLLAYRERFLRLMETIDATVTPVAGLGLPLRGAPGRTEARVATPPWPASVPGGLPGWRQVLAGYARSLEELGEGLVAASDTPLRDTLLPVAARVIREGSPSGGPALIEARRWVLERIARHLGGASDVQG